jgi:flagellar basal-body rod modification protein FlgD
MSVGSISGAVSDVIGKDVFLKMLVAQLKNQDPLNPLDGTDFAAQLAQFSSLEQLTNLGSQLQTLTEGINSMNNSQMTGLIGCNVSVAGNRIEADGTVKNLFYALPENVVKGEVNVYDNTGALVKTIEIGSQTAGTNSVTWDSNGLYGNYSFEVKGINKNGDEFLGSTLSTGTVTGVNFQNGSTYLMVNGRNIAFSDIASISR